MMTQEQFKIQLLPLRTRLFRVAMALLRDVQEAEDTLQDVYLKLWKMKNQLNTYRNVEALAVTMTRNACLDRLKAYRNRHRDHRSVEEHGNAHPDASPDERTELNESMRLIDRIVGDLPEKQRLILRLRDMQHYDYDEITEMTGMSRNAVKVTLSRARKKVRNAYQKWVDYEHR